MDLELWAELSAAIDDVGRRTEPNGRDTHPTARVVRVQLWSVPHARPTCRACRPDHSWTRTPGGRRPCRTGPGWAGRTHPERSRRARRSRPAWGRG